MIVCLIIGTFVGTLVVMLIGTHGVLSLLVLASLRSASPLGETDISVHMSTPTIHTNV